MPYKLKDDVDLKELEKLGFENLGVCYEQYYFGGYQYFINKETREIKRLHPYDCRENPSSNDIEFLGLTKLVEKVGE